MTRTVARLILAMLLLPATGAVFILLFLTLINMSGTPQVGRLLVMWAGLYTFVGTYWVLLWRDMVTWNRRRVALTAVCTVLSLAGGFAVGAACLAIQRQLPPPIAVLIGGGTVPITWVLATVLIWRETAAERLGRLTARGTPAIACPLCGYDLAGLTEVRCPECGASFTLEQIVLARPRPVPQSAEL
jgi:DNA-directed RNA polymerase subunit RPC12/RpoP